MNKWVFWVGSDQIELMVAELFDSLTEPQAIHFVTSDLQLNKNCYYFMLKESVNQLMNQLIGEISKFENQ